MTNANTTATTAETLAAEIVECWTAQAGAGHVMDVGTSRDTYAAADEMGIYADLSECPEELHEEIVKLVREGFEAFNESRA